MFSWIILIVSIVMLVFAVSTGVRTYSWVKDARTVQGTVVDLIEKKSSKKGSGSTYAPQVRYVIDGKERDFVSSHSSSPPDFKIGESVSVACNPQENHECIATFGELYGFSVGAGFLGMALTAIILCMMNGDKLLKLLHPNIG